MEGCTDFIVALIFLGMINIGSAQSSTTTLVTAVLTFGDSTMDVGNNNYLRSDFKANFPPYGRDFENHTATGRFCNGKLPTDITGMLSLKIRNVLTNFISLFGDELGSDTHRTQAGSDEFQHRPIRFKICAHADIKAVTRILKESDGDGTHRTQAAPLLLISAETLGFKTYQLPYLSPQAAGKNLLIGASFASAGSGYSDQTTKLYHAISLSQQLEYFKEYQSKLVRLVGRRKANDIIQGALYIVGAGTGDFVQNYYINSDLRKLYSVDAFSELIVEESSKFVKGLYSLGARRIGVTSLSPLGCLPAIIRVFGHGTKTCVTRFNEDALTFNRKLNHTVLALSKQYPEIKIAVFDIYQPIYDLVTAPSKQGFTEAKRGCCLTGASVKTSVLCKPKSVGTCSNATSYVFWDSVHPSEAANKVIADSLLMAGVSLIS